MNASFPQRGLSRPAPVTRRERKPARPFPAISQHVPVTSQNRSYLRAIRQAEMEAWNASADAGFDTGHFERKQAAEKERRDLRAFGLIALMAVATVTIGLLRSSVFVEKWAGFVSFVRHLLG